MNPNEDIAENDPVRVVDAIVEGLDLREFKKLYHEKGCCPYHPKMMLKIILYAYMNNIFTQVVLVLADKGFITLDVEYIDGTKIESKANKYTFVWRKTVEKHRDKLGEYDGRLEQIGERNSMSKSDPDAMFMRMKEDAMNNGQTKPGYNLQISVENQFITDYALFPNPTDTLTLIPFLNSFPDRYGHLPSIAVADSGYGSEENYRFMAEAGMEAYVKYNRFHLEQHPRYKPNTFNHYNFHYNAAEDYYVCPMGQHMTRIGTSRLKTASGYRSENARYRAQNCNGCPLRCLCYKAKGDRRTKRI